jgi:hypothetical protein
MRCPARAWSGREARGLGLSSSEGLPIRYEPHLALEGFVASCNSAAFAKATPKVPSKGQDRLHPADQ